MRFAVTGGSGLVGRAIVRRLALDHEVVNIDIAAGQRDGSASGTREIRPGSVEHSPTDVTDLPKLCVALRGADVIVHAAGIPGPTFATEHEIMEVNVEGTRNVGLAAAAESIGRIVFVSSEAVLGFVFSKGAVRPRYLPVDESHPLAPAEPYGRSKLLAEAALARSAPRDSSVVCLRPPWVWTPEEFDKLRELTRDPGRWWDGLWAYVHGDDLALAVELAATRDLDAGVHAAYVVAPDNGTERPTRELVREHYPGVPVDPGLEEFGSLISSGGLRDLVGFAPEMRWREFLPTGGGRDA